MTSSCGRTISPTLTYTVLAEKENTYHIFLNKTDPEKEEIINLATELGKGKEKVMYLIYTDKRAYEIAMKMKEDTNYHLDEHPQESEIFYEHFIAVYSKNFLKSPQNTVLWMGGKYKFDKDTMISN